MTRMTFTLLAALATATLPALTASAGGLAPELMTNEDAEAIRLAEAAGVCSDLDVVSATFNAAGQVEATCGDVTAFVPVLLGGFGPTLGALAAAGAVAAVAAGGDGGATSGTTN